MRDFLEHASLPELLVATGAFFVVNTVVGLAIGFTLERAMPERRIWSDALAPGQLRHELIGNVVFVTVSIVSATAVLGASVIRFGEPGAWPAVLTFFALNFGFQAYFYLLHRTLHHPRLLPFHRWHHVSRVTTPLSGQSTHLVEAIGWMGGYVLLPLALSFVVPISASGLVAYMAYNVIGNIVGHANVEVVPVAPGLRTRSLLATVFTYHALHHLRYTGHFGFASTWMDRAFGTEWPDWMTLHARVDAGESLTLAETRQVTVGADAARLAAPAK